MDELAQHFAERGFRVICPDTIGRGLSQWSPAPGRRIPAGLLCAARGRRCCDALALERVHWVGTSMGGAIGTGLRRRAGRAAHEAAHRAAWCSTTTRRRSPLAAVERIRSYAGQPPAFDTVLELEAFFRTVYKPYGWLSDAQWRRLTETSTRRLPDGRVTPHYDPAMVRQFIAHPDDYLLWPHYDAIDVPVLCLRGAESDLVLPDDAGRDARPRARRRGTAARSSKCRAAAMRRRSTCPDIWSRSRPLCAPPARESTAMADNRPLHQPRSFHGALVLRHLGPGFHPRTRPTLSSAGQGARACAGLGHRPDGAGQRAARARHVHARRPGPERERCVQAGHGACGRHHGAELSGYRDHLRGTAGPRRQDRGIPAERGPRADRRLRGARP